MVKTKYVTLDVEFVKKLKLEAMNEGVSMVEFSRRLAQMDEPFKKRYCKENEKKNYWIKL